MSEDKDLIRIIEMLAEKLDRLPTEEEVTTFIFGTNEVRKDILEGQSP